MKTFLYLALISVSKIWAAELKYGSEAVIHTSSGAVRGRLISVSPTRQVYEFLGIPFAEPPTGERRFQKPVPKEPWQGTFEANKWPNACPHSSLTGGETPIFDKIWKLLAESQSEDCLHLNIWVPAAALSESNYGKLAAFTWIHGGGFMDGATSMTPYNGSILAGYNNIIVTSIQYRLGSLGFAFDGSERMPGNMGLWDQLMALKWICENLPAFGGNCDDHTIAGESAGAGSVTFHLLSHHSRKYFKRAIAQSGSALLPLFLNSNEAAKKVTEMMVDANCKNSEAKITCMKELGFSAILNSDLTVMTKSQFLPFRPVVDGDFLLRHPSDMLESGDFYQVPLLIGANKEDGSRFLTLLPSGKELLPISPNVTGYIAKLNFTHYNVLLKSSLPLTIPEILSDPIVFKAVQVHYWPETNRGWPSGSDVLNAAIEAANDISFKCSSFNWANMASKFGEMGTQTYAYQFSHLRSKTPLSEWMGVYHGEEIGFVFGEPFMSHAADVGYSEQDSTVSRSVMSFWANFVKYGDPNGDSCGADDISCVPRWTPYTKSDDCQNNIVEIGSDQFKSTCGLKARDCSFWLEVVPKLLSSKEKSKKNLER